MLLLVKQKRRSRGGALKALDFATTGSTAACDRFVLKEGLPSIFARFMGKSKVDTSPFRSYWYRELRDSIKPCQFVRTKWAK